MTSHRVRELWKLTRNQFPHRAEVACSVCPDTLPKREFGDHASVVLVKGTRTFGFTEQKARDHFVIKYAKQGARAA